MEKKHFILSLCLGAFLAFFVNLTPAQAQSTLIKGTVVDSKGETIIGASVKVEGVSMGTVTDIDGNFSLQVPPKSTLVVSYIGYASQTLTDLKDNMKIVLKEDMMKLDEVVVVGYSTQKMKNITGSVSTVSPKDIGDLAVSNLGNALTGTVAGLNVAGGDSRPGAAATISVRQPVAKWSKNAGDTSPLFVIDDFIADATAFNNLDANEIESISVLKDASAAVYGARSSQGVILVKTKRGKAGAPKISYNGQFSYVDKISSIKMLDAYDYGVLWNGVRTANPDDRTWDSRRDLFQADELEAMRGMNYDLLDKAWSGAFSHKHNINISGGSEKVTYFGSVSYFSQEGNLGKLDYDRWNYRAGMDAKIGKGLKVSLQISGDYGEETKALNKIGGTSAEMDYNMLLTNPRYIPDNLGGYPLARMGVSNQKVVDEQYYNFFALQDLGNMTRDNPQNMRINSSVEYDFGWSKALKGLKLKFLYSKAIGNTKGNEIGTELTTYVMNKRGGSGAHLYMADDPTNSSLYTGTLIDNGNHLRREMTRTDKYQMNFIASYERTFGQHDVSALFTIEKAENESEYLWGMVTDPMGFTDGQSVTASGTQSTEFGRSESGMLSYVGRVNYAYAGKYLFEFLIRSDASTKFDPKNYWGTFPSFSAGWVVSEENWFKKYVKWMDYLKLRASFGLLGKDNVSPWAYIQLYSFMPNKGFVQGDNWTSTPVSSGATSSEAPNPDAHWDKSYQTNAGIDMRFLKNRLSVGLDGYYYAHRDVFMNRAGSPNFPGTVGTQPAAENFGEINTYGIELSLGWRDMIGDLNYFVKLNTSYNDSKMLKKAWPSQIPYYEQHPHQRTDLGEWGLECIGMFRSNNDIEEYFEKYNITDYLGLSKNEVKPGMLIYRDIRGAQNADGTYGGPDGKINKDDDMVRISKRADNPYNVTLNFGGDWKNFSLSAQVNASWGGYDVLPKTARGLADSGYSSGNYRDLEYTNVPAYWADNMFVYQDVLDDQGNVVARQNLNAKYPNLRFEENTLASTFWKINSASITLRNVTLGYSLPKPFLDKIGGISACRFTLTGQNLLSFYNPYPGHFMDPLSGVYGAYPSLRTLSLGVNVSF